jgi:signal transduction histidine kinase/ABC-type uncharacterized transport system substrate-binding protein
MCRSSFQRPGPDFPAVKNGGASPCAESGTGRRLIVNCFGKIERSRFSACHCAAAVRWFVEGFVLSLAAGMFCSDGFGAGPAPPPHVLVLYGHRQVLPINLQWDRGIRAGIEANFQEPVAIDVEYLDFERLQPHEYRDSWVALLRRKYADDMPDVVIPVNNAAAECVAVRYSDLFPNAAVVFCSVNEQVISRIRMTSRMTGVSYRLDFQGTLEMALRFFPATHRVIVVSGTGEDDVAILQAAKAAFARESKLEFSYWTGLPIAELRDQASRLESGAVILFLSQIRDREGRVAITPRDVAQRVCESARVPVFGLYDTLLGAGIVGGNLGRVEEQGQHAGAIAARVLRGERPADIPISGTEMNRPMFDWRQLRRWGISERELPEGSLVRYRERTVWEKYWGYIMAFAAAIGMQTVLIVALLVNRRKLRRAEHALADQLQFETALSDISSRFVEFAPETVPAEIERALGRIVERLGLDRGALFLLSDDGQQLRADLSSVRTGEAQPPAVIPLDSIPWMWHQLVRGEVFHFSSVSELPVEACRERELANLLGLKSGAAVALQDNGRVFGMLKFGLRTREQPWDERILQRLKLFCEVVAGALAHARADAALSASRSEARQLAGRLLTAQEDERRRLAREMHDDVSQRLAAAAIQAGTIEQQLTGPNPPRAALVGLREHLIALSEDVHRLSRQLHPAILDDLGLKDALRAECDRVAERGRLAVNFRCGQLPPRLPGGLALCVYRVAQEAMHNAIKHAHTDRVEVTLNVDLEFLDLEVRDFGRGFDPDVRRGRSGLGLASMEERVRLVGGEILVSSSPGQGTSIQVRIPWPG